MCLVSDRESSKGSMSEAPVLLNEPWPESPEPRLPTAPTETAVGIGSFQWSGLSNGISPEKETEELVRHVIL